MAASMTDDAPSAVAPTPAAAAAPAVAAAATVVEAHSGPEDVLRRVVALTLVRLRELDAERGVSEHESAQTAAKLQADLMAVMETRVREQRDAVQALSAAIDACIAAIREHAAALHEDAGLAQLAQIEQQQAALPLRAKHEALSKLMSELAQKKQLRYNVIANTTAQSVAMARDLQEPLAAEYATVGGDFSASRMAAVEQQHKVLMAQHLERCDTAARAVADIMALWNELGANTAVAAGGLDAAIAAAGAVQPIDTSRLLRGAKALSRDTMAALSARKQQLVDLRTQREHEAKAALVKIVDLYGRLNVPALEREQFLAKVQSATFTPATMAIYATELARVEGLKSANAKQLVEQSRAHIQKLWKELRVAEAEKKQMFPLCFDATASDDAALSAHEQYLAALKRQMEDAAPLLRLIATREDSRAKLQEFHFNNANQEWRAEQLKGSKAFLWRKTEEEMHKLEKTALPKLDAKLLKMLADWAAAHNGAPFRVDGEAYADCMARQADDDRAAAEQRKIEEDERRALKRGGTPGTGGAGGNPNLSMSTSMRMSDIGTVQAGLRPASAAGARPSLSANALMGTLAAVNAAVNGGVRASMYTPAKAAPASTITPARGSILIKTAAKVLAPSTGAAANRAPTAAAAAAAAAAAVATPSKAQRFGLPATPLFDSPTKAVSGVKLAATTPAKAAAPTVAASVKKKTGAGKKRKSDEMLGTATPAKQPLSQEQIAAAQAAAQARANKAAAALKAKSEEENKADDAAAAAAKQAAAAAAMAAAQARANKAAAALRAKSGAEKDEPTPKADKEKEPKDALSAEQQKAAAASAMAAAQARANRAAAVMKAKAAAAEEAPEKPALSAEEAKAKAAAAMVAAQKRANKMAAKQKADAEAAAASAAEEEERKQQPAAKKAKTGPSRAKSVDAKAKGNANANAKKKMADNKKAHATLKVPKAAAPACTPAAADAAAPAATAAPVAAAAAAAATAAAAAPAPMEAAAVAPAPEVAAALAAAAAAVDATPAPMCDDAPAAEAMAMNTTVDASVNASVALHASAVMNASVAAVTMADVSMAAAPAASAPAPAAAAAAADAVVEAAVADAAPVDAAPTSPVKPKKTKKGKAKGKKKAKGKGKKAKAAAAAAATVAASESLVLEDVTAADTGADAEEDKENLPAAATAAAAAARSASAANVMAKAALTISVDKSAALASSSSSGALAPLSAGKRGAVTPPNAVAAALVIAGDDAHSFKAVLDGKKLVEAGQYTAALEVYTAGIGAAGSQAELCALYHARSTLYNHLKEYDRAIADSDRAMRADESAAVAIDAN